jgi:DNA-binding MarR family transcriptional regulator
MSTMSLLPILNQPPGPSSLEEEAFLGLMQTTDSLSRQVEALFKPSGLSPTQFNVLRILHSAGEDGLSCGQIALQMITRDPDMTRLLDRLEKRELILRRRDSDDRRVVRVCITRSAIALLFSLDEPLKQFHRRQLKHMNHDRLRALIELLEQARNGNPRLDPCSSKEGSP